MSDADKAALEERLDDIGKAVADRSDRTPGGVEHTLIWLAAKAGAREYYLLHEADAPQGQG